MRDILNLLDQLNESTGLAGRKPGDVFRNAEGDELTFNEMKFFPEGGGKYSPEELEAAVAQVEQQNPTIQWLNKRNAGTGGFGLAGFSSADGEVVIGQFLKNVNPDARQNYIPNSFNGYKFGGAAAVKAQSGLTPQELLTQKSNLTITDIMNQLAQSLGTNSPLYAVAHRIATGEPLPMEFPAPEGVSFTAFRDYFCEILQPMAIQKGQWTGNAGEAAQKFLDGTFEGTTITFDDSKIAGLSDSILTNSEGKSVKISTKGKDGATASTKNLLDGVEELKGSPNGRKLIKKYQEVVDMLGEIKSQGMAGAPLYLGVQYGIITPEESQKIANLKGSGLTNLNNVKAMGLSKSLQKLALERTPANAENVNLYYHLIAVIAHKVAEEVNNKTNFSKAAADILNNGALVQVYTKASEGKNVWKLNEFLTVYPGDSIKGVYLTADKNYFSTGIKGNFTFKIDRGAGKPKATAPKAEVQAPAEYDNDLETAASQIAGGTRSKRKPDAPKVGDVGRTKRSK